MLFSALFRALPLYFPLFRAGRLRGLLRGNIGPLAKPEPYHGAFLLVQRHSDDLVGLVDDRVVVRNRNKLALLALALYHVADLDGILLVQSRVHFIKDVKGRGLEGLYREKESQRREGFLAAAHG